MKLLRGFANWFFVILTCCFVEAHTAILSRNKAIKSSSTFFDWVPSNVIDGSTRRDADTCQCCSASIISLNPWLELDFGKSHRIHTIVVIGRLRWDVNRQSFKNMQVMFRQVSLEGFTDSPETTIHERLGNVTYVLPVPTNTRYISLVLRDLTKHFVVCELIVYGDCEDGEYGDYCEKRCNFCDGDLCDKVTGICPSGKCLPGYFGDTCDTECQNRTYGPSCTQPCGNCFNVECNKTNGNCPGRCSAGYQGAICKQECNTDYYGQDCLSQCGSCINGETCNHVTGMCTSGCTDGYLNQKCNLSCIPGNHGKNCQKGCGHCRQGTVCLHANGTCPSGCVAGYQGDLCITACSDGSFGDKCQSLCGNCKDDTACNKINGVCDTDCTAGYKKPLCVDECDDGTYGEGCVSQCERCYNDTVCDKMSGICTRCAAGFNGNRCDIEDASSYCPIVALIGGTIGAILLIEAFVGAVVYIIWKRRQGQVDRRSPEEVSPYEMPDRAAFASEHLYELEERSVTTTPTYENPLSSLINEYERVQ